MRRWRYVLAVVVVTALGATLAGVRHGALMIEIARMRAKSLAEEEDRAKSHQLQVELFAEGLTVRAAAKIQAELRAGRPLTPGLVLEAEAPLGLRGVERIRGQVTLESQEGDSFRLETTASAEVVTPWRTETFAKEASLPVEITKERIGDLGGR